jgi:hypothetical protein
MTTKQRFIVAACAAIVFVQFTIYASQNAKLGVDFAVYRQAGMQLQDSGWLYLPPLRWLFTSFAVFPPFEAYVIFGVVNFAIFVQLPLKLSEYPYGWILALVVTKIAAWTLVSGNIAPALAALCLTPAGCILAGVFKPYLFIFLVLHLLAERLGSGAGSGAVRPPRK